MNQPLIFLPMLAQVLLTAIVFFYMYHTRVKEMRNKSIHPQKIATSSSASQHLVDSTIVADNFSNQLEMPVLFYVLTLSLYVTQMANTAFLILASLFVVFRYLHCLVHCTYNKVLHRFYAYAVSSLVLWSMWVMFAYQLISSMS